VVKIYRTRLKLKVTPKEEFSGSDPPPAWISWAINPPSCENFQFAICRGVCIFSGITHLHWQTQEKVVFSKSGEFRRVDLFLTQNLIQHMKKQWDFPAFKEMVEFLFFDVNKCKTYVYSEWTNQIELPVLSQRTSRSDLKLRCHKMVIQFLPIPGSSLVSTPKTVNWQILEWKLAKRKCQGILWGTLQEIWSKICGM